MKYCDTKAFMLIQRIHDLRRGIAAVNSQDSAALVGTRFQNVVKYLDLPTPELSAIGSAIQAHLSNVSSLWQNAVKQAEFSNTLPAN